MKLQQLQLQEQTAKINKEIEEQKKLVQDLETARSESKKMAEEQSIRELALLRIADRCGRLLPPWPHTDFLV